MNGSVAYDAARLFSSQERRRVSAGSPLTTWRSEAGGSSAVSGALRRSAVYRVWSRCVSTSPMTHRSAPRSTQSSSGWGASTDSSTTPAARYSAQQRRSRSSRRARCWTSTCWGLADVAGRASRHAPAGLEGASSTSARWSGFCPPHSWRSTPPASMRSRDCPESMDHEVRQFGIRVALVEPGFTRTNIDAAAPGRPPAPATTTRRGTVSTTISPVRSPVPPDPTGWHGQSNVRWTQGVSHGCRSAAKPRVLSTLRKGCLPLCSIVPYAAPTTSDGRPTSSVGEPSDEHPAHIREPAPSGTPSAAESAASCLEPCVPNVRMPDRRSRSRRRLPAAR